MISSQQLFPVLNPFNLFLFYMQMFCVFAEHKPFWKTIHIVLVKVSVSFLRAMFLSEMSEAKQEMIEIKDFDGDAIQDLVHFAYSSKLTLTVDNVQPLLYAACILQVKKHKCSK